MKDASLLRLLRVIHLSPLFLFVAAAGALVALLIHGTVGWSRVCDLNPLWILPVVMVVTCIVLVFRNLILPRPPRFDDE